MRAITIREPDIKFLIFTKKDPAIKDIYKTFTNCDRHITFVESNFDYKYIRSSLRKHIPGIKENEVGFLFELL